MKHNLRKYAFYFTGLLTAIITFLITQGGQQGITFLVSGSILWIGVSLCIYYFDKMQRPLLRFLIYTALSTIGYYLAVSVSLLIMISILGGLHYPLTTEKFSFFDLLPLFLNGFLAGFFIAVGTHLLYYRLRITNFIVLSLTGGLLGYSTYIPISGAIVDLVVFIVWQAGMATVLGLIIQNKYKPETDKGHRMATNNETSTPMTTQ